MKAQKSGFDGLNAFIKKQANRHGANIGVIWMFGARHLQQRERAKLSTPVVMGVPFGQYLPLAMPAGELMGVGADVGYCAAVGIVEEKLLDVGGTQESADRVQVRAEKFAAAADFDGVSWDVYTRGLLHGGFAAEILKAGNTLLQAYEAEGLPTFVSEGEAYLDYLPADLGKEGLARWAEKAGEYVAAGYVEREVIKSAHANENFLSSWSRAVKRKLEVAR